MFSREPKNQSGEDLSQFEAIVEAFGNDHLPLIERIEAFPRYVSRQSLARFLTKYELFKKILRVNGSIVECGVLYGAGLLAWAKLSSILEPVNHTRKIIGFDTFTGFPEPSLHDLGNGESSHLHAGGLEGSPFWEIMRTVEIYDLNRPLRHIHKIEVVRGDFMRTGAEYLTANPHLVVSLLYLDFDLYEPTKKALEVFRSRMPRGAVIVFDELNARMFPGETQAVNEVLGLANLKIERFVFDTYISFAVL